MHRFRTVAQIAIFTIILGVAASGVSGLLSPSYTDQQIQASLVDTWEAEAWSVVAMFFLLSIVVVASLALAYRGTRSTRQLSGVAVLSAISAGILLISSHVALTDHVTQLTGQTFGAFYGLL